MAKEKDVIIVNTGLAAIHVFRERILPDQEMAIPESLLETDGIQYLISRGEIEIKDDSARTKEIKAEAVKNKKKSRHEGKTQKELEDGGVYQ